MTNDRPAKRSRFNLADALATVGFVAFVGGVALVANPAWALMVGGGLLLSVGIVAAWRRS
jgi:hypothetical protein